LRVAGGRWSWAVGDPAQEAEGAFASLAVAAKDRGEQDNRDEQQRSLLLPAAGGAASPSCSSIWNLPSALPERLLSLSAGRRLIMHGMHSVTDWLAFAVWEDGKPIRSLSLSPGSGIMENTGEL
jgi:hypothetical protein